MAKIKQPIKDFWESNKKPSYLKIAKKKIKDDIIHNVKFVNQKSKQNKK